MMRQMQPQISPLILSLLLLLSFPSIAGSETVLEEIQRTGVLKVALRQDAPPFGYLNSAGEWSGFCLDFIARLKQRVRQELGRDTLLVKLYKSTLYNRFETINNKVAYLECGPNTIQNNPAIKADFSTAFWISGTQFLIRQENYNKFAVNGSLKNSKIGVLLYTSTQAFLARRYPQAIFQEFQGVTGRRRAVQALQQQRIDAVAGDGIVLLGEAVLQGLALGKNYLIVPEYPLNCEYYGLILPQGDSRWRTLVNSVIEGERSRSIYRVWFGVDLSDNLEKLRSFCATNMLK